MKRAAFAILSRVAVVVFGTCLLIYAERWASEPIVGVWEILADGETPLDIAKKLYGPVLLQTHEIGGYTGKYDSMEGRSRLERWALTEMLYRQWLVTGFLWLLICIALLTRLRRTALITERNMR